MTNIVVVDSELRPRERLIGFLTANGYSVHDFGCAAEALRFISHPDIQVNLVVAAWDTRGEMSCSEFLLRLRQQKSAFPRIVIAPGVTLDIRNRAFALGAVDLVLKPVVADRLLDSVRRALGDPAVVDPLVAELRKELIGNSPAFLDAVVQLSQAIRSGDTAVLLIGPSGVGKEIFAQLIHRQSRSSDTEIVAVNIAGLSPTLIESELFGHEEGAFTGADHQRVGKFEQAGKGTLFFDEIGDLDVSLQPKLLRAIEERTVSPVGGNREIEFQARLVCATKHNLIEAVKKGAFREDLYYRISKFEIRIPPLCERMEDLRPLISFLSSDTGPRLAHETLKILESYSFPGNVRELQDILRRAQDVCQHDCILPADLPGEIMQERESPAVGEQYCWPRFLFSKKYGEASDEIKKEFDRVYLPRKIRETGDNKKKAAELMGITPRTLRDKLKRCGLGHLIRGDEGDES